MNRLGFAKVAVSGEHPLTAPVWVNRAWERFFGAGLVRRPKLRIASRVASHPDLLDGSPRVRAREVGLKAMHRLVLTSATYRQSSRSSPSTWRKIDNRSARPPPAAALPAENLRDRRSRSAACWREVGAERENLHAASRVG